MAGTGNLGGVLTLWEVSAGRGFGKKSSGCKRRARGRGVSESDGREYSQDKQGRVSRRNVSELQIPERLIRPGY